MSRSKRQERTKRARGSLSQFGLPDIASTDGLGLGEDSDVDDAELEEELKAILGASHGGQATPHRPRGAVGGRDLDSMVAIGLRDQTSADEDDSGDDDPSLLAELSELTGVPPDIEADTAPIEEEVTSVSTSVPSGHSGEELVALLSQRLDLYTEAEKAATVNNDLSKARRYKRGLDQLKVLLRRAENGGSVDLADIPVAIAIPKPPTAPVLNSLPLHNDSLDFRENSSTKNAPQPAQSKEEILATLSARRDKYKVAAVTAKRNDDLESALSHVKIVKRFEVILKAVENDEPVDLSSVPQSPSPLTELQSNPVVLKPISPPVKPEPQVLSPAQPQDETPSPHPLVSPSVTPSEGLTVLGALESRLAKYLEQEESAKQQGNSGKVRRMGRIVKQYRDAIALHNRGMQIPFDELPTPPGFPPFPVEGKDDDEGARRVDGTCDGESPPTATATTHQITVATTLDQRSPVVTPNSSTSSYPQKSDQTLPLSSSQTESLPLKGGAQTRCEKQSALLMLRQREYKEAALKAKQSGDLVKAKEYLRLAKGFDTVLEASRSGLPVDMDTLPPPLSGKASELDTFQVVRISDCIEGSDSDIFDRLLTDLGRQLKLCLETANHFKAMGDIANANRFENFASDTKKDLNTVRGAHITSSPPPKFHYQQRTFSIVRCNVDLNDNDLELSIIKGINYNVPNPKEIDTYIKYEFPYPNDEVRSEKTMTIYNTNNPEYNSVFTIPIMRSSRPMQRIFKRHSIKLHIWSKGGFLRSDQLVATVQVKLQPLETKCAIHDAFDLMDGRKPLGGKLEVKIRLRNPIGGKQVEQVTEKWLIVD